MTFNHYITKHTTTRPRRRVVALFVLLFSSFSFLGACTESSSPPSPLKKSTTLQLVRNEADLSKLSFDVIGLPRQTLAELSSSADEQRDAWNRWFAVYVDNDSTIDDIVEIGSRHAMLGRYEIVDEKLRFISRFPIEAGTAYIAVLDLRMMPESISSSLMESLNVTSPLTAKFSAPEPDLTPTTKLTKIYPSSTRMPENLLKFYFHFSASMSRGDSYRYVELLDESGKKVEMPFLELAEELWDPEQRRFTLYFDPGRIKRGLKPREIFGPALIEGGTYTLVLKSAWPDAKGRPLVETVRKTFQVDPPDDTTPDPNDWELQSPVEGENSPLVVTFPEPMDHALLERLVWVEDQAGNDFPGIVSISDHETVWKFTPDSSWGAGTYSLSVDSVLEDRAGNSIGQPFEVDLFSSIDQKIETKTIKIPFQVKPADKD